ncbi:MAG: AAA family ATPase, partial [Magnetococcales bacterium]|nr:AAA family ATPase [Magnetococcales bacterium]
MYLQFFGLTEAPFTIVPNPRFVFFSKRHKVAFSHLVYSIRNGDGIVVLTGEVGTGKTTLARYLIEQQDEGSEILPTNVEVAIISNTGFSVSELMEEILKDLRIPLPPLEAGRERGFKAMVDALNVYLLEAHGKGRNTVVIIDEAQNLSTEVLEKIRLLTNLETFTYKLLQIILIGQPELKQVLARNELRQLDQRVTARYHILPMDVEETREYIHYRLRLAGRATPIFTPWAVRLVHLLSGGVPREINKLCDRSLLGAWALKQERVGPWIVQQAAREMQDRSPWRVLLTPQARRPLGASLAVAALAVWLVGL